MPDAKCSMFFLLRWQQSLNTIFRFYVFNLLEGENNYIAQSQQLVSNQQNQIYEMALHA